MFSNSSDNLSHLFAPIQNRNALRIHRVQRLPDGLAPLGEAAALAGRQLRPAQVLVDLDQVGLQPLGCLDHDGVDLGPAQCSAGGNTVVSGNDLESCFYL